MIPAPARPRRGLASALLPLSFLPLPGRGAVGSDLCPKAGWPQSVVRVRAAKVESRDLGVPVCEGACLRERKCLACPAGSYDPAIPAVGLERGARRPRAKGWAWVAERCGDRAGCAQSTGTPPRLPSWMSALQGAPHRPTRLSHSSRLGSRFSLRNGWCGPGRGLCQKQQVLLCGFPQGSPDAHAGCKPSLTTLGVKGHRIRK